MDDYMLQLAAAISRVIALLITGAVTYIVLPLIRNTLIPWLKEKHIYSTIQRFVQAAEKQGEVGTISKSGKKRYVIALLEGRGITITAEVDAMIESAVKELDWMKQEIIDSFDDEVPHEQAETAE